MALSKRYFTVQGEIIGEKASGGSRVDYLTDALGSVTATVDQNAQVVNTHRYKPYGSQLAKTGAGADPRFRWVGALGYRATAIASEFVYVRRRTYFVLPAVWTTIDPLRFANYFNSHYSYAFNAPTLATDKYGLFPTFNCEKHTDAIEEACAMLGRVRGDSGKHGKFIQCMKNKGFSDDNNRMLNYLSSLCNNRSGICFICLQERQHLRMLRTGCQRVA